MCKPDKPDPVEIDPPDFLRNPFLDQARNPASAARALRAGRSSLRIPLGQDRVDVGASSGGSRGSRQTLGPSGNGRRAIPASGPSAPAIVSPRVTGISI